MSTPPTHGGLRLNLVLGVAATLLACGGESSKAPSPEPVATATTPHPGVDAAGLSPVVDNPYVAFSTVKRSVYEGTEFDPEARKSIRVRVETSVRDTPETVAGMRVTVVDVSDFQEGELVEKTVDYYAQSSSGDVYYIGERVNDYEGGKVIGHGGTWLTGENGARAGVFMPKTPKVGDAFEQERAPGIAEDRSKIIATNLTVTVPAGTFKDCIETEDYAPIDKRTQRKCYCKGVGLVREIFGQGGSIELIKLETR